MWNGCYESIDRNMLALIRNPDKVVTSSLCVIFRSLRLTTHPKLFSLVWTLLLDGPQNAGFLVASAQWSRRRTLQQSFPPCRSLVTTKPYVQQLTCVLPRVGRNLVSRWADLRFASCWFLRIWHWVSTKERQKAFLLVCTGHLHSLI